jgi:3-deoxy-D-arabino-heptulosonate 7-phosphate (DAHP) synthase
MARNDKPILLKRLHFQHAAELLMSAEYIHFGGKPE